MAWPTAERSASGATTLTSPSFAIAAQRACRPAAVIPSSLVTRIRVSSSTRSDGQDDLAELLAGVEVGEGCLDVGEGISAVDDRLDALRDHRQNALELARITHRRSEQVGVLEEEARPEQGHLGTARRPTAHDPAAHPHRLQ